MSLVSAAMVSWRGEVELESTPGRCTLEELRKIVRHSPRESTLEGVSSLASHRIVRIIAIIKTLSEFCRRIKTEIVIAAVGNLTNLDC